MCGDKIDYCMCLVEVFCTKERVNIKPEIRMFAGITLKLLVDKKYERICEREVESSDSIKDKLTKAFYDPDAAIRALATQIMTKMIIVGDYYSWTELIDFLTKNLLRAEILTEDT